MGEVARSVRGMDSDRNVGRSTRETPSDAGCSGLRSASRLVATDEPIPVVTFTVVAGTVIAMTQAIQMLAGGSLLHQLARDMTTTLDRRLASFGLTSQQAALLLTAASGQSSPRQLMGAVGTDTAGMTRLLDRLEVKGLATRHPHPADRRSVLVQPTDRALQLVPKLVPVFGEVVSQLFEGFSSAEITQFSSALRRMRENLQQ